MSSHTARQRDHFSGAYAMARSRASRPSHASTTSDQPRGPIGDSSIIATTHRGNPRTFTKRTIGRESEWADHLHGLESEAISIVDIQPIENDVLSQLGLRGYRNTPDRAQADGVGLLANHTNHDVRSRNRHDVGRVGNLSGASANSRSAELLGRSDRSQGKTHTPKSPLCAVTDSQPPESVMAQINSSSTHMFNNNPEEIVHDPVNSPTISHGVSPEHDQTITTESSDRFGALLSRLQRGPRDVSQDDRLTNARSSDLGDEPKDSHQDADNHRRRLHSDSGYGSASMGLDFEKTYARPPSSGLAAANLCCAHQVIRDNPTASGLQSPSNQTTLNPTASEFLLCSNQDPLASEHIYGDAGTFPTTRASGTRSRFTAQDSAQYAGQWYNGIGTGAYGLSGGLLTHRICSLPHHHLHARGPFCPSSAVSQHVNDTGLPLAMGVLGQTNPLPGSQPAMRYAYVGSSNATAKKAGGHHVPFGTGSMGPFGGSGIFSMGPAKVAKPRIPDARQQARWEEWHEIQKATNPDYLRKVKANLEKRNAKQKAEQLSIFAARDHGNSNKPTASGVPNLDILLASARKVDQQSKEHGWNHTATSGTNGVLKIRRPSVSTIEKQMATDGRMLNRAAGVAQDSLLEESKRSHTAATLVVL